MSNNVYHNIICDKAIIHHTTNYITQLSLPYWLNGEDIRIW